MIDITQEPPEALDLAAQFLSQHAALKRAGGLPAYTGGTPFADVPAGTQAEVPVPPVPVVIPPPPPPAPSNVVAFPTPVPPAPTATAPATSTANPTSVSAVVPPAPPAAVVTVTPPNVPAAPPATPGAPATDDYDSSGFPFDARIHQKGKGTKKDGTWKLQKGIDAALVTAVTQELANAGRMRTPGSSSAPAVEVPAAPSFPGAVPLPPVPSVPVPDGVQPQGTGQHVPVPPPPAVGAIPVPPPPVLVPPAPSAAVPVPPAPVLGVPDAGHASVVPPAIDFRSLVAKITAARNAGKITPEQVTAYIQQAGAPSLQLLNSMPHLIGAVNDLLDMHLAMA
jgi:hypothetical protein